MPKRFLSLTFLGIALSLAIYTAAQAASTTLLFVSGKGSYWQTVTPTEGSGSATITVNESQKNQNWLGLGGCFNEKGWEALQKLSAGDRDKAIKLLFDANDGIGFTWGRIPIGASDYGLQRYTLNQTTDDFEMTNFSIEHDKSYLIPYVKAAMAVKPDIQFWASAWTPPTWMKTGAKDAAGYDGGAMKNDAKYLKANALYTIRFIESYKTEGIPIKAIFPQNEPGYTCHYPSCGWGKYALPPPEGGTDVNGTEYLSDYVATHLVPLLQSRAPTTDLWFGTLSNNNYASAYWNGAKSKAGQQIKGVGLQWNNVSLVSSIASAGYLVMCSEHQCGNYPWKGTTSNPETADSTNFFASYAPNNHNYAVESWRLIATWIKAGVNIYSAWNMVLDTGGFNLDQSRKWPQCALLAVNYQASKLKITPVYYVFRHIGQYVVPGAVRIGTSGGDALAFRNPDSSIVVAAYSNSASTTSVSVRGKTYSFSAPAQGFATLVIKPASSIKGSAYNQFSKNALKITSKSNDYKIALPSREAGRIELLTASGKVLESKVIPQGSREILLSKQAASAGLLLVRVIYQGESQTLRLFSSR
jgi:glucosylceramidase